MMAFNSLSRAKFATQFHNYGSAFGRRLDVGIPKVWPIAIFNSTAHSWSHQGVFIFCLSTYMLSLPMVSGVCGGSSFPHPVTFSFRQIGLNWTIYFFPRLSVCARSFAFRLSVSVRAAHKRLLFYFVRAAQWRWWWWYTIWIRQCVEWIVSAPISACWLLNEMLSRNYIIIEINLNWKV